MCLVAGSVVKLTMGIEPAFYVDRGPPTYAFRPCGHMATEKTVKFVLKITYKNNNIFCRLYKEKIFLYIIFCIYDSSYIMTIIKKRALLKIYIYLQILGTGGNTTRYEWLHRDLSLLCSSS